MTIGTTNMSSTAERGESPAEVNTAKLTEPKSPAAPVPDDQVDTTFLATKNIGSTLLY